MTVFEFIALLIFETLTVKSGFVDTVRGERKVTKK